MAASPGPAVVKRGMAMAVFDQVELHGYIHRAFNRWLPQTSPFDPERRWVFAIGQQSPATFDWQVRQNPRIEVRECPDCRPTPPRGAHRVQARLGGPMVASKGFQWQLLANYRRRLRMCYDR